jgi:hypothetical protein
MPRIPRFLIVLVALLALSACGHGSSTPTVTPSPARATVSAMETATPVQTVAVAPTDVPTSVHDIATITVLPSRAAPATVRASGAPSLSPTPPAAPTRAPTAPPTTMPPTAVPPSATPGAPRVAQIPAAPPRQTAGTTTDGLVLLNVRTGTHDGYTRLVFDFAKADGSAAPVPRAQMWTQNGAVVLVISGVRQDTFGQTLGSGDEPINTGSVVALYRIPSFDDASVAYGISTKGPANATLTTATGPARLIVDIPD